MKKNINKNIKRNNKIYMLSLSICFILFLTLVVLMNITVKEKKFSEIENRMLAQKPKISLDNILEGRYSKKYEKYIADQFAERDKWMNIKTVTDKILKKKEENGVYIGKDGYLIENFKKPNEDLLKDNIEAINNFAIKYENIKKYMMIVPNAVSILEDKLPKYAPIENQKMAIDKLETSIDPSIKFVDLYETLSKHKEEEIYYRTDHHWTTDAAYYGFLTLSEAMELNVKNDNYNKEIVTEDFHGTLSSKVCEDKDKGDTITVYIPKDDEDETVVNYVEEKKKTASLYDSSKLLTKDKYGVFLGGNHPLVKIKTTAQNTNKLLLIKDSYANSLVQFLTPYFSEIIMIDPRYYYEDMDKLIEDEQITDTLFLYNANTFFQDSSLEPVLNNE